MKRSEGVPVLVLVLMPCMIICGHPPNRLKPSFLFPRAIKNYARPASGGERNNVYAREENVGNPAEWTMSKANLVAEFYTTEPASSSSSPTFSPPARDRSQKSFFSFFTSNNNSSRRGGSPPPPLQRIPPENSRFAPYPPPHNGNFNLVASETNYNPQALAYENSRHGGYSTPFRPIFKFPQQNYIIPPNLQESGYPQNLRPPRGPPPHGSWGPNQEINGLRPPLPGQSNSPPSQSSKNAPNPPGKLYLPPTQNQQAAPPQNHYPPPTQPVTQSQTQYLPPQQQMQPPQTEYNRTPPQMPQPQAAYNPPQQQMQPPQTDYNPPSHSPSPAATPTPPIQSYTFPPPKQQPPPPPPLVKPTAPSRFVPSQEYLPPQNLPPESNPITPPKFQPGPPPPQILENYRNQAVYPVPPQQEKPLVLVMANGTSDTSVSPHKTSQYLDNPPDSFTQYESGRQVGQSPPSAPLNPPSSSQKPGIASPSTELALTEPLSQVLAEANAKAGDSMDKTIRFVIHKPEDEDVVKNAILEDAQTRYEDVRFVQGPTLKVQRKETVYLPPKKKTVVYILLKEPQIDTDVEVMTPEEEEPVPEVYITYQKSDGAVKTKHYSPKPIKEEDMKKYLDIEADSSYSAGEESILIPRFSKSTSVSLSTSSKTSRMSASMSATQKPSPGSEINNQTTEDNLILLRNHRILDSFPNSHNNMTLPLMKTSPLLYSQRNGDLLKNSTKRARSSSSFQTSNQKRSPVFPSPRRISRNPVQCQTNV